MRLIITGGAGFIGSHIADQALSQGWDVAVIDNLVSGRKENVPEGATFYEIDICNQADVDRMFAEFKPTAVSHQAAPVSYTHLTLPTKA